MRQQKTRRPLMLGKWQQAAMTSTNIGCHFYTGKFPKNLGSWTRLKNLIFPSVRHAIPYTKSTFLSRS